MAKAQSVIDVMLGEGGGKTAAERYADYLAIASVIANRAAKLGVTPEQVVQKQSEFSAYKAKMPAGVDKYRGLAQKALAEVARNGPVHNATFYATPKAIGGLPPGLKEEVRTGSHIYKSDPQNRSINTSIGYQRVNPEARYQPTVTLGSTLIGPVTNATGDTLIGPVPGSKPVRSYDTKVSAPNFRGTGQTAPQPGPTASLSSITNPQQMYSPAGHVGVGQGGRAGGAAMFAGGITSPAPGFEAAPMSANSKVYSAPLNAPGVAYSPAQQAQVRSAAMNSVRDGLAAQRQSLAVSRNPANYDGVPGVSLGVNLSGTQTYSRPTVSPGSTLIGPVGAVQSPHSFGGLMSAAPVSTAPVQAISPVQATPTPGDTLIGRVPAQDIAAQKAAQRKAEMPGLIGKIGGSVVGGALLGPLGSLMGGLLGGYAAKNGLKDAPLNINNIGAGANNVYGVYSGAARGTQANTNNGGMVTSLGNGDTAYTNKSGVTSIQDRYGNNMADWSGRSYTSKK